jgi:hypothetical protein
MVTHYFHSLQNIIQVLGWCKGHRVPAPSHCRLGHSRCFCVLLAQNADSTSSRTSSSASTSCESLSCHEHLLLWVLQHVCEQRSGGKRGCEPWLGSGGQGRRVTQQRAKPGHCGSVRLDLYPLMLGTTTCSSHTHGQSGEDYEHEGSCHPTCPVPEQWTFSVPCIQESTYCLL